MNKTALRPLLLAVFLVCTILVRAQELPRLEGYVTDEAGIFTASERELLTQKLQALDDSTSNQIAIYTTLDLKGMDIGEFAVLLGRANAVGQKDRHNGLVIVIRPKTPDANGEAYIAVGYGLEGAIPDAVANQVVDNEMIPEFRNGNYYAGVHKGVDVLAKMASGEIKASGYKKKGGKSQGWGSGIGALVIIALFLLFFFSGARRYGRRNNLPFWLALGLFNTIGSRNRGSWGGFSGGGGGGGGFGGFGGGSFGGGGAGGSW